MDFNNDLLKAVSIIIGTGIMYCIAEAVSSKFKQLHLRFLGGLIKFSLLYSGYT